MNCDQKIIALKSFWFLADSGFLSTLSDTFIDHDGLTYACPSSRRVKFESLSCVGCPYRGQRIAFRLFSHMHCH